MLFPSRSIRLALVIHFGLLPLLAFSQESETAPAAPSADASVESNESELKASSEPQQDLRFSFDRTEWRDVFTWLASEAGLALHVAEVPIGTFTYSDPNSYSTASAIDRINMFLLPDGFSLVRSEGLLAVVNLRDARSLQRLDALARTIAPEELQKSDDHEIVKCFFPLNELRPSEATSELSRLQLMTEPTALVASKQLVVIDTARKLRNVQAILDGMRTAQESKQSLVRPFVLQHVDLEDLLTVARPHLGIEPGLAHSEEINISSDNTGKKLFVSGTIEAVKLLESLISVVDVADSTEPTVDEASALKSHRVRDQNLSTVYDVLQTVLVGQSVRLSMEPSTNSIVALANDATHKIIESTIVELEGLENIFAIIPLRTIDPYFTITLLDEMFDLSLATNKSSARGIKIDADPSGMRLFVRGPKDKVEEIQKVVAELDGQGSEESERVVPIFGARAESVLDQAKSTWAGENPIHATEKANEIETEIIERTIHIAPDASSGIRNAEHRDAIKVDDEKLRRGDFVSSRTDQPQEADPKSIGAKVTARGIVLESEDSDALNHFETHLRTLANGDETSKVETIIYYLKYASADEATHLLADLIDGASSVVDSSTTAKLVNGAVPSSKSMSLLGSYLRSTKDGSKLVTSGTLTVISDARLNRLICVGTTSDLTLVEQYLKVIDKDSSLTSIETHGVSHVIELQNAKAEDIADVLRDTYGDRVALNAQQKNAQRAQQAAARERGNAVSDNNIQASRNQEAQMSIAVHEISNSIVVTAPDTLFQDVKQLVEKLDQQAEQAVEVIYYPSMEGVEMLRETLQSQSGGSQNRQRRRSR